MRLLHNVYLSISESVLFRSGLFFKMSSLLNDLLISNGDSGPTSGPLASRFTLLSDVRSVCELMGEGTVEAFLAALEGAVDMDDVDDDDGCEGGCGGGGGDGDRAVLVCGRISSKLT